MVGDVTEVFGDDDGSGEALQGVGVAALDGVDEVVEAYGPGGCAEFRHASTLG
ncbi:hypothetical protein ACFQVA_08210 [Actinomadura keratinilytica]